MVIGMTSALKEIEAKIRSLRPEEKTELLRSLIADLDGPPDSDVDAAWLEVAKKQYQEILKGKVKTIAGDKVFERVRKRLKR